jgi:hypothetical protein
MSVRLDLRSHALLLAAALLTSGLAGCVGWGDSEPFATFDEARDQVHTEIEPVEDRPLRLGLVEPNATSEVPQGQQNVTLVLWNEDTGEPVDDAQLTLDAFMPMMSHGTSPEEDPEPVRNGVYRGSTNLMMGGHWLFFVNATLASGQETHFEAHVNVTGQSGMDGGHGMDDNDEASNTSHDSYEDARSAEGETFAAEDNDTARLKLLEPQPRRNLTRDRYNVTFLLYDEEADEPHENGTVELAAEHDHQAQASSPGAAHLEHGIWQGTTSLDANGTWTIQVTWNHGNTTNEWSFEATVGNTTDEPSEPPFEPYTVTFEDDVSSPDYQQVYDFDVEAANATVTMNGTLENATALADELTVQLTDPDGDELGSFTLSSDATEASLSVDEAPAAGAYQVNVTGQAIDSHYRVDAHVGPP